MPKGPIEATSPTLIGLGRATVRFNAEGAAVRLGVRLEHNCWDLLMTLRSSLSDYRQYFMSVRCPHCAAMGKILWEGSGERKTLVRISAEFYERLCRLPPYSIELVCRTCGTPQLE